MLRSSCTPSNSTPYVNTKPSEHFGQNGWIRRGRVKPRSGRADLLHLRLGPARSREAGHTAGAKPHSKNHRTVRAPGTGLSSFLQLQSLGKSQRIAIAPMHSEQPRCFFRHHRATGGQYPHAKLYPLPLASSKNHLKSAETNLRPKLQLFCDYGLRRVLKRGFWSENAENQPRKGPFLPCWEADGSP